MDYYLGSIRTDRNFEKELGRMRNQMDYLLYGMIIDRNNRKKPSRVEKEFLKKNGMKMVL